MKKLNKQRHNKNQAKIIKKCWSENFSKTSNQARFKRNKKKIAWP